MSILQNLGFGTRSQPPAYKPSAGMESMMGGAYGAAGADAAYAPSGYSPDTGMYDMMGATTEEEEEDFLSKLMAQLKKNGKKKGGGADPLDVYQGMKPVQPFSIIGRPGLLGR